jgi:hypothetical protein
VKEVHLAAATFLHTNFMRGVLIVAYLNALYLRRATATDLSVSVLQSET